MTEAYCDGENLFISYRIESEKKYTEYNDYEIAKNQIGYEGIEKEINSVVPEGGNAWAWKKPDGTTVSCTEKVKVLEENWRDIREALQDALDDAILMGCTESQFKAEYKRLVESLTSDSDFP